MSVLDRIKQLDAEKTKLLDEARTEALETINTAIKTLNELGYHYRIIAEEPRSSAPRATGTRRGGVREEVLRVIGDNPEGINRADILDKLGAKGDKKAEQSISNALANLKKTGTLTADGGLYKAS